MRINAKFTAVMAAAGALAVAAPATARPVHPNDQGAPTHPSGASHASHSHRCRPHNVAYVEAGTVDGTTPSTLTANSDGTWSGILVLDVTNANRWAQSDTGKTVSYTFTNAHLRVRFDGGATSFTAGEEIELIGKLAAVAKKCTALSPAATPLFRGVVVQPAAA